MHRFLPRYRGLAWGAMGIGGGLATLSAIIGASLIPIVGAGVGVALGAAYLRSPTWKLAVVTDEQGLAVRAGDTERFRLAWSDIVKVVAAPTSNTAFIDGGAPERSVLIPGDGAPAPYGLENAKALFDTVLAHVPADRVERVESLDKVKRDPA
ncbi:MAG TPA: hypothetical protein VGM90_15130 [Kofleriaceae bacterium]